MLNLHNYTRTKPKPTVDCKNCSHVCDYQCLQLSYTTQHRTVLMILQTIIIVQTMYTRGEGGRTMPTARVAGASAGTQQ